MMGEQELGNQFVQRRPQVGIAGFLPTVSTDCGDYALCGIQAHGLDHVRILPYLAGPSTLSR